MVPTLAPHSSSTFHGISHKRANIYKYTYLRSMSFYSRISWSSAPRRLLAPHEIGTSMSFFSMVSWSSAPRRVCAPDQITLVDVSDEGEDSEVNREGSDVSVSDDSYGSGVSFLDEGVADKGEGNAVSVSDDSDGSGISVLDEGMADNVEGSDVSVLDSKTGEEYADNNEGSKVNISVLDKSNESGVTVSQGVDLSFVSPVENRVCWVKVPSGVKMKSIKWWPALLYDSFNELIQDVGESSM